MTTGFIWNNNLITSKPASAIGFKPGSHGVEGVASIHLDDRFVPILDGNASYDELKDNKGIPNASAVLPGSLQKRSSNRGSSEAASRFTATGYKIRKGNRNFSPEILVLAELVGQGHPKDAAFRAAFSFFAMNYGDDERTQALKNFR